MDMSSDEKDYILYVAVTSWDFDFIDDLLRNGANINASLVKVGPEAGYTALHFACMEKPKENVRNLNNDEDFVSRLIRNYGSDVNAVGEDGAQPFHLACLLGNINAVNILAGASANIDAEFSKDVCEKYKPNAKWTDDFGGKLTPLAFAIINNEVELTERLLKKKANVTIKSTNNKTLLMYAVENGNCRIIEEIIQYLYEYPELINAYDNDGLHLVHYFLPDDTFGEFRYVRNIYTIGPLMTLKSAGMNINATVNGDPNTLLLNRVAFRGCYYELEKLLDFHTSLNSKSRALHYATLPVDPDKFMAPTPIHNDDVIREMKRTREKCIKHILENYIIRRSLELFVPQEEKELMDQLVATDSEIRQFVKNYQQKYIEGILKNNFIQHRDVRMTLHELMLRVLHRRPLNVYIDDEFVEILQESTNSFKSYNQIREIFPIMVANSMISCRRKKLLDKVQKIRDLKKALPLPYEIILEIIKYVDNHYLRKFIDAFYEIPLIYI